MKLYDNPYAPNPRRVRVFLAEGTANVGSVGRWGLDRPRLAPKPQPG